MKRICLICFLSLVVLTPACSRKPKPNPAIATEVEEGFKQRWIAKRMNELMTGGTTTDAREARRQAAEEFRQRYEYTSAAKKGDPVGGPSLP
jgi:hypothetical protein